VSDVYNVRLKGLYYIKDAHYNIIKAQKVWISEWEYKISLIT
jgi:hypothetical protein